MAIHTQPNSLTSLRTTPPPLPRPGSLSPGGIEGVRAFSADLQALPHVTQIKSPEAVVQALYQEIANLRFIDPFKAATKFQEFITKTQPKFHFDKNGYLDKGYNFKATYQRRVALPEQIKAPFSLRIDTNKEEPHIYIMANVGPENRPLEKRQGLNKTVRFQLDVSDGTLVVFKKPKKERGPLMDRSIELFNRDRYITRKLGYFCNTVKTEGKGEYSVEKAMDSDCFDFYDELNRSKAPVSPRLPITLFKLFAEELHKCHTVGGYVHGDVKLENMLISGKSAENLVCTLIDFDFSMKKEEAISDKLFGTFGMFAPELLETLNRKPVEYSTRSDVFAMGVCFLNMFCGELVTGNRDYKTNPLIGLTEHISGKRILEEGMTDERISCYVDENFGTTVFNARLFSPNEQETLKDIIKGCLKHEPDERVPLPLVIEKLTTLLDAEPVEHRGAAAEVDERLSAEDWYGSDDSYGSEDSLIAPPPPPLDPAPAAKIPGRIKSAPFRPL